MFLDRFNFHPVVQQINTAPGLMLDRVDRIAWDQLAITLAVPTKSPQTVTMGGIPDVHPIVISPDSARFRLKFDQLVTFLTTEERYSRPISEGGDLWCTAHETSPFLSFCADMLCADGWFSGALTHYRIVTFDDVIDVICAGNVDVTNIP